MSKQACGLCGKDPASGWAKIGDVRYCHGDFDPDPTCYMASQWYVGDGTTNTINLVPDEAKATNEWRGEWRIFDTRVDESE